MTRCCFLIAMGLLCSALSLLANPCAEGGILTVEGPTINWNGGPSPKMTLTIKNPTASDEKFVSYQLDLLLIPGPGAQGILKFDTISAADVNYVFQGNSLLDNPSTLISATAVDDFFDFVLDTEVNVEALQSFGLVTLDFDASDPSSPSGYFYIVLAPFNLEVGPWYFPLDAVAETSFGNTSEESDWLIVGIIGINVEATAVPEPAMELLFLSATALALVGFARRAVMGR
ncbi:MAG: hypothetical protein K8T91_02835 [Planctomycetes bacterium]|nr:hypothetical protein [Planctomycetota bacterium]